MTDDSLALVFQFLNSALSKNLTLDWNQGFELSSFQLTSKLKLRQRLIVDKKNCETKVFKN